MAHSQRQLYTIKTFGKKSMGQYVLHSGPFGCGKTYVIAEAFGLYCYNLRKLGFRGLTFVLLGKTQQAVKKNVCNVLSKLYGADFRYDQSMSSGVIKDATLFGQNLYIIGLNDTSSEAKFRGITDIMGIIHDEAVLCTKEQFGYIMGRLRGEDIDDFPEEYVQRWYVGSTNPDVPTHFLLEYVQSGILKMVKWYIRDACWSGAAEYYERLRLMYADNSSFYDRYLKGKWTSADKMIYKMFNPKKHIVDVNDVDIDYSDMQRNFIAVDFGGDHPTAILLISLNHQGIYIVSKEWKFRNTAPSDIVEQIQKILDFLIDNGTYCRAVYVDPAAKALKDELVKNDIAYVNAMNRHADGIGCVQTCLSLCKLVILSNCKNLISEMYSYRYKDETKTGKDEVVKLGDDFADALRYGVYTDSMIGGK